MAAYHAPKGVGGAEEGDGLGAAEDVLPDLRVL